MENYVYIYFDPRKKGEYQIDNIIYEFEPIYVGKGINKRYKKHLSLYKNTIHVFIIN